MAPNPAWRLVHLLATMRDADGTVLVKGFADDVAPLSPAERAAIDALPVDEAAMLAGIGASTAEPPAGRRYYERLTAPTFTINSLTCEDAGEHRTVIPSVAIARCDVRLVGGQRVPDVIEALRRHVAEYAPDVEFRPGASMSPSRTLPESPYTDAVVAGAAAGLGEQPLIVPALGGSLPIAAFTDELARPCYGVPFANVDEANHARTRTSTSPGSGGDRRRGRDPVGAGAAMTEELFAVEPSPMAPGWPTSPTRAACRSPGSGGSTAPVNRAGSPSTARPTGAPGAPTAAGCWYRSTSTARRTTGSRRSTPPPCRRVDRRRAGRALRAGRAVQQREQPVQPGRAVPRLRRQRARPHDVRRHVRDLASGATRTAVRQRLPDDRYLPMLFSADARHLLVLRLHQNTEHDLFAVDLHTGAVTT